MHRFISWNADIVASLYLIVPVALLLCALAVVAWLWASRSGQFDDLDRESRRILHDDPRQDPVADQPGQDQPQQGEESGHDR